MEIRRIFSLLSPVKSRIAVLFFFIGKLSLFYNIVDQQEADQPYIIILHIGQYCKGIADPLRRPVSCGILFGCPGLKVSSGSLPRIWSGLYRGAGASLAHKQGLGGSGALYF
jgi:hypothetical protein